MTNSTEIEARKITPPTTAIETKATDKTVPAFVEAEMMLEKLKEITKEIGTRAFDFFRERGGELGRDVEDWFKAESEILRPTPVEMTETGTNIFVTAAVPGFKPDQIEVSVKDDLLIISGTTETNEETRDANTLLREWKSDRFYRQLELPSPVMPDKVTATLTDGMLKLTLPKAAKRDATKVAVASA